MHYQPNLYIIYPHFILSNNKRPKLYKNYSVAAGELCVLAQEKGGGHYQED